MSSKKSPPSYQLSLRGRQQATEEDGELTQCGIFGWRPKFLQPFASPFYFMLVMSLVGIFQSMTGSIFFGTSSTLEKRFGYDSKLTGIIMVMDNFAEIMLNPFVSHLAVRVNRARLIACGEVMLALSCFITAAPYFIYGPGTHLLDKQLPPGSLGGGLFSGGNQTSNLQFCSDTDKHAEECAAGGLAASATVWPAVACLLFGSFMRGLGYTCYVVVGLPYLDDNSKKKNTPMYISTLTSLRLIGPATGFMLASFSLSFYENPFMDPKISRKDPRFIGAWWLSFVIVGTGLLLATLPLFLFPPQLKGAPVKAKEIKKKIKEGGGSLGAFKRIVTNPLVMCCLFANSFRLFGLWGYIYYKSKYIESQFRQSSSTASFLTGISGFVPQAVGIFAGGALLSYIKPRPKIVFMLVFVCELSMIICYGGGFFLGCEPIKIDGQVNSNSGQFELVRPPVAVISGLEKSSLSKSCNADCHCSTNIYAPMCSPTTKSTFFSPCHAGCTTFKGNSTFTDCACLPEGAVTTVGYCPADIAACTNLVPYVLLLAIGGIIASTARTPNALISLRNVEPHDKAFAIGFAAAVIDLCAFIPASIVFGLIIDNTCLIWETKCGKTGNCWVYDQVKFRNYLHGASVFCFVVSSCFDFSAIFMAHRVKNFYDDDDDKVKNDNNNPDDDEIDPEVIEEMKALRDF